MLTTEGGLFDPAQTLAPEIPYQFSQVEKGFITLGNHDLKSMIGEVARRALLTVWYYKWNIHRRLRPEEFAGRIDEQLRFESGPYPFYVNPLTSVTATVLPQIYNYNGNNPQDPQGEGFTPSPEQSYLLPHAIPRRLPGSPVVRCRPCDGRGRLRHADEGAASTTICRCRA